jgi:indolepyruvate ferredoxin oxidoreductase
MDSFDAEQVAVQLIGDSIYTNPLMLGFAWQKGRVPLAHASLMRAIELNGVQVDNNKAAFEWGRRCAHDLAQVEALFKAAQVIEFVKKPSLTEMVSKRIDFLTAYQNAAYAQTYQTYVEKVRAVEAPLGKTTLTEAVARYLFKLMAYKDEYEVARLHTDAGFLNKVNAMFEGDFKLNYHLAPPLLAAKNDKGELQKRPFGPWMLTAFRLLARLKGLRGTPLDVFGRSEERRTERALINEYQASVDELLATLSAGNHGTALEIARIPEMIKGYGHVKARHLAAARPQWAALLQSYRHPAAAAVQQAA